MTAHRKYLRALLPSSMAWVLALCLPVMAAANGPEQSGPAKAGASQPLDAATMSALGISETPAAEAAGSARPVAPESGTWSWTPGQYSYDGSGNITAIGTEAAFLYDVRGRLVDATLTRAQATEQRGYSYDAFGNRTAMMVGSSVIPTATSTSTNHLTGLSAVYDVAGNVTQIQPPGQSTVYQQNYDALGTLQEVKAANVSGTPTQLHIYTADDERLWTFDLAANASHWKIRDLDGKVLRDYYVPGTNWTLSRDYIYRDGRLLAAVTPTETLHFSLDHLGTPRVITGADRNRLGFHHYLPFGEEWTDQSGAQEGEVMKFTGHERDPDAVSSGNGFDYMHARYYSANVGRFLSIDPEPDSVDLEESQSWNRYSYVWNNPIANVDPDGRCTMNTTDGNRVHQDDSIICVEVNAKAPPPPPRWTPEQLREKLSAEHERQKNAFLDQVSRIAMAGSLFGFKFDGPSISKHGNGRLFQIRFGPQNQPRMLRLDINSKGLLEGNYQRQGKGSRGFNKHIPLDPRNLVPRGLVAPRPFMPLINPCMLNPQLCDPYGTDA